MRNRLSAMFMALVLALAGAATASAQETSGTLSGKLTDNQGLSVPGATVTVTGPQGSRSFTTDTDGRFNAPFLTPGNYSVRAELTGFKRATAPGITITVGMRRTLPFELSVGALTETVQVTAESPLIDTKQGARQTSIKDGDLKFLAGMKELEVLHLGGGLLEVLVPPDAGGNPPVRNAA